MKYYRKDNNDIDKFIIDAINNINSEIESLDKRISNLENGNNNNVINNNNNEGANFMINGQPEISISFFSELASIIYSLGFHNLFVSIISILETKLYQRPVAVMHWRVCYIMGAD